MDIRLQRRTTGLALVSVLIVILLTALIGAASLYLVQSQFELSAEVVRRQQAWYAAEAGLQHALWRLRTDMPNNDGNNITPPLEAAIPFVLDGRTITVTLTAVPIGVVAGGQPLWQVSAAATYPQ